MHRCTVNDINILQVSDIAECEYVSECINEARSDALQYVYLSVEMVDV